MPRPLNADVAALMRASSAPPLGSLAPAAMRESYVEARRALAPPVLPVGRVRDMEIPGQGGQLPVRLYQAGPEGVASPCLVFLHGGGWVLGNLDTHDAICRRLAIGSDASVLAVDYRLAPEHPFPAALEDGATALRWLAAQAAELGIDADRLAVGGDSAGGNLAAVLALMGRDGAVPRSAYQVLFYPATDLLAEGASYREPFIAGPLSAQAMRYFLGHYLPETIDRSHWHVSPLRVASLAGVPPAFVLTCGHDPLESEGRAYVQRLEADGVTVTALHANDQAHGILNLGTAIGAAPGIIDFAASCLKEAWRQHRM